MQIDQSPKGPLISMCSTFDIHRFGHPSDIGALFTGESSAKDYGLGLIFLPVIVLSIFFIWNVLLIVFKCFCSGNILGGAHLRKEEEGGGDNDGGVGRLRLKNCIYRGTIFLCAVSIVMLSTLSYMRLSGSLNGSFGSIRNTIDVSEMLIFCFQSMFSLFVYIDIIHLLLSLLFIYERI